MAERRYGPVNGAGTVIIEKDAEKQIEKGSLGTTVYLGVLEKGPSNKLFKCGTKNEFLAKAGGYVPESFLPDAAFDFFSLGRAAGDLYCVRITDGTEVPAEVVLYGRKNVGKEKTLSDDCVGQAVVVTFADYLALGSPKATNKLALYSEALGSSGVLSVLAVDMDTPVAGKVTLTVDSPVAYEAGDHITAYSSTINPEVAKIKAANGGRWGGKKDILFGTSFGVGGLSAFTFDTGKSMLEDYFVGAQLRFSAMPGKAYSVVANDTAGTLYVSADSTLDEDYAASGSSDETWSVQLSNNGKALAVVLSDGVSYPDTRFGLEVYCDGVRVLQYNDLSLDPQDKTYYKSYINDDDSNVYIEVEDLWFGAYTPDVRPANLFGQNVGLTNTVLTGDAVSSAFEGAGDGTISEYSYGGNVQEDLIEVECTDAGSPAVASIELTDNAIDVAPAAVTGADVTGTYPAGDYSGVTQTQAFINLHGQGDVLFLITPASCVNGAATAAHLELQINTALSVAGKIGSVTVTWDTDHFVLTTQGQGLGATVALSDTGMMGGSLATELKLSSGSWSTYIPGSGDSILFNLGAPYTFSFVSGVMPVAEGRVAIGGDVSSTLAAFKSAIENWTTVDSLISSSIAAGTTLELTSKAQAVGWGLVESDGITDNFTLTNWAGYTPATFEYSSAALGVLSSSVPVGVPFVAPNDFVIGFTLEQGTVPFEVGDKFTLAVRPWEAGSMVDGWLFPDVLNSPRSKFKIISNTASTITVKATSEMLASAKLGSTYRVEYREELSGGYDGLVNISDSDYIKQLDSSTSPINTLFGEKKGLVKIGIPGVTSVAVQKAGIEYAEARNYQFRVQIPSNIVTEEGAESFINDSVGRNDFAVVSFPSFMYVPHPTSSGLKLVPNIGAIHGREALWAKNYAGYHKAASGIDVTLPNCVKLTTGDKVLNEELLNKHGIGIVKSKTGNFIVWGSRTLSLDPAWKWKHQREQMSYYENDLRESFDWIIFAINDKVEQKKALSALRSYFIPEHKKRALRGDKFEDAVKIKLDDENNTNLTMANGDMNAEIGLRLADTVERFIITMSKLGIFD